MCIRDRYVIKFTKGADIKFIGHLDLMRTIQRIIKRSGLPVEYSKGFNPNMALSIAQPLSVGVYSDGEYLDLVLTESLGVGEVDVYKRQGYTHGRDTRIGVLGV